MGSPLQGNCKSVCLAASSCPWVFFRRLFSPAERQCSSPSQGLRWGTIRLFSVNFLLDVWPCDSYMSASMLVRCGCIPIPCHKAAVRLVISITRAGCYLAGMWAAPVHASLAALLRAGNDLLLCPHAGGTHPALQQVFSPSRLCACLDHSFLD